MRARPINSPNHGLVPGCAKNLVYYDKVVVTADLEIGHLLSYVDFGVT